MKKYNYTNMKNSALIAEFSFTDVDGNNVTGICCNNDICDLLDNIGYGYLYNEALHPVHSKLIGDFNGVTDITKPIYITIMPLRK